MIGDGRGSKGNWVLVLPGLSVSSGRITPQLVVKRQRFISSVSEAGGPGSRCGRGWLLLKLLSLL